VINRPIKFDQQWMSATAADMASFLTRVEHVPEVVLLRLIFYHHNGSGKCSMRTLRKALATFNKMMWLLSQEERRKAELAEHYRAMEQTEEAGESNKRWQSRPRQN
jgi:hypothetical protein